MPDLAQFPTSIGGPLPPELLTELLGRRMALPRVTLRLPFGLRTGRTSTRRDAQGRRATRGGAR